MRLRILHGIVELSIAKLYILHVYKKKLQTSRQLYVLTPQSHLVVVFVLIRHDIVSIV